MTKADWIWMPQAGHHIFGERCGFHLCTYVNGYIVSTVGNHMPDRDYRRNIMSTDSKLLKLKGEEFDDYYIKKYGYHEVSSGRHFETMVFPAEKITGTENKFCQYRAYINNGEIEGRGYNCIEEATEGHYEFCFKFDEKKRNFLPPKIQKFEDIYPQGVNGNDIINMIDLAKAIKQFNHNINTIKDWMSVQGTHNLLFIDRITELERAMKNKADYIKPPDRIPY